ncbi:IS1167%2C transposase [Streptococcus pneumoniae]|nr:IS1167%2C transposase [Streptococcus pneumoniae]
MSFIAQDFDNLNIITVLEGRTITMDMFSPYYAYFSHALNK